MKPPVERIRVSQRSRDTLVTLKRCTGIEHWNVLCRWALLDSLANPNKPIPAAHSPESNIEMSWELFAGNLADKLPALLAVRAVKDGVQATRTEVAAHFLSHLERGIEQLGRKPRAELEAIIVLRELAGYSLTAEQTAADNLMQSYEQGI